MRVQICTYNILVFPNDKLNKKLKVAVPDNTFDALLMQIPLTAGLPLIPSNLTTTVPSSFTETAMSTNCKGLLAPTIEKMSKSDTTCIDPIVEFLSTENKGKGTNI